MKAIREIFERDNEFVSLCDAAKNGYMPMLVNGVCEAVRPLFCHTVALKLGYKPIIVVPDEKTAYSLASGLAFYGDEAVIYPSRDFVYDNITSASHEFEQERLSVLLGIIEGEDRFIITVPDAVMQYTVPPSVLENSLIKIRLNEKYDPASLEERLTRAGYQRADSVEGKGQYSHRGGIFDIFSPSCEFPCRVDFFGDEPDSMGYFDTVTQRRISNIEEYTCVPVSELLPDKDAVSRVIDATNKLLKKKDTEEKIKTEIKYDAERASAGYFPNTRDKYFSLIYNEKATLLDYLGNKAKIVFDSKKAFERARAFSWQNSQTIESLVKSGRTEFAFADVSMFEDMFVSGIANGLIAVDYFMESSRISFKTRFNIITKTVGLVGGNTSVMTEELCNWMEAGRKVVFAVSGEAEKQSLVSLLDGIDMPYCDLTDEINDGKVNIFVKPNGSSVIGFEIPTVNLVMLTTEGETIRSRVSRVGKYAKYSKRAEKIASYSDLTVGDLVVHVNHGIGVYDGLKQITADGATKDYLRINYADGDVLYVPCGQSDLVSKYIGSTENIKINKLSSSEWARTKAKAKYAAKDIAKELIKIYAARQQAKGYAFPHETELQEEFESLFEYEETEGQLTATEEIKADMEKTQPMDRILCGDVGFGKTEVALRAVFKCVAEGKQAAILVPTTILALQHYRTIISRFRQFPVEVRMLSRFTGGKDTKETITDIASGRVNIVVGTHKLLGSKIKFYDLGLLVIDEEQRFGVKHKEQLKEFAADVDVLTLSATPIPRTLNMALSGIRDMSVLEEAPRDRAPVQSYVLEYDETIIDEAIRRELRRGGQVFYLHNVVESIYGKADDLAKRFPGSIVAVGHGQMSKEELSAVWQSMVDGSIDIFVCTTIIETGVDVPNANTLIIEDADRMGLSQLHQIRGRVGRSPRKAYAYFTYREGGSLTEDAAKRLEAIRDFTEFGSGFKIAMRDLEIRGAGNLLGSEQSGHMEAIGYDLYIKILEEAVNEEKGIEPLIKKDCLMEINCDAFIPEEYMESPMTRIDFYRKIALLDSETDRDDLVDEMMDRFGDLPQSVENLMNISLCRNNASGVDIEKITHTNGILSLYPKKFDMGLVESLLALPKMKGRISVYPLGIHPHFGYKLKNAENVIKALREVISAYSSIFTKNI